jgi:hypothetical protein
MKYIILFLVLLLFSCSPQGRINRILKNNPHLIHKDTVKVTDTFDVIVPGVKLDGHIPISKIRNNPFTFNEENLSIEVEIKDDTLSVRGECDTLIIETEREILVPCETPIFHKPRDKLSWLNIVAYALSFSFFVLLIVAIILVRQINKRV